jgi:hypothetical protein
LLAAEHPTIDLPMDLSSATAGNNLLELAANAAEPRTLTFNFKPGEGALVSDATVGLSSVSRTNKRPLAQG